MLYLHILRNLTHSDLRTPLRTLHRNCRTRSHLEKKNKAKLENWKWKQVKIV